LADLSFFLLEAPMKKLKYKFKNDMLFKTLFCRNPDLLKQLVSELLGIRLESIEQFIITNPEIPPNNLQDKFCKLDINMTVNGQCVNLEIQVRDENNYPDRMLYYWAREYSTALPAGEKYKILPRTIIISIIDFNLFSCDEYHSVFKPLEINRYELFSDKMNIHIFELEKIPANINEKDMLLLWLSLFKAETVEELKKIEAMEVPVMNQAINAYYNITAESEFRESERLYEKARHDEASALNHAREEESKKWQVVVADKDAEIARLKAELEKRE